MTWGRAALQGALSGAVVGLLIGWLFAIFDWFDPAIARGWLIVDGLWFGTLVGAMLGLLTHALLRGRRDFASVGAILADRYDVVVDPELVDEATRLLGERRGEDDRFTRGAPAPSDTPHAAAPTETAPTDPAQRG
jgi:hypothetical protein